MQELDGLLYRFLWNDKIARVKKETVTTQISDGGLKMINIYSFHIAQKAMWVKRLVTNSTSKWSHLFRLMCGTQTDMLDYKLPEVSLSKLQNTKFHHRVLQCWFQIKGRPPDTTQEILKEYICFNKYITIANHTIIPKFLGKNQDINFLKVYNLLGDHDQIGFSPEIKLKLQLNINLLKLNSLINAIPAEWISPYITVITISCCNSKQTQYLCS